MATRNFVPRSGSEGQIGTSAKPWGVVVADIGHFARRKWKYKWFCNINGFLLVG